MEHVHWRLARDCPEVDCYKQFDLEEFDEFWALGRYTHFANKEESIDDTNHKTYFGNLIHTLKYVNAPATNYDDRIVILANKVEEFLTNMKFKQFDLCVNIPNNRQNSVNIMRLVALRLYKSQVIKQMDIVKVTQKLPVMKNVLANHRKEILKDKYSLGIETYQHKISVLILDDVIETGTTSNSAASAVRMMYPNASITGLAITYLRDPKVQP